MSEYGQRYIDVSRFVSYCKSLNIDVSEGELEFLEREKLLFPAARILIPEDYVKYMFDIAYNPANPYYRKSQFEIPDKWTKIYKLLNRTNFPIFHKDDGVHLFDKQIGRNKYITQPIEASFKDWNSFKIIAGNYMGHDVKENIAKHFYHYWQIYQIIEIQRYLEFCCKMTLRENKNILQKKNYPLYYHIPYPKHKVADGDYLGMNNEFDALSFFTRISDKKEVEYINKGKPIGGGYKRLSTRQANALEKAKKVIAEKTCCRFRLDEDKLWNFLRRILELHVDYERKERFKQANEIRKDVLNCMSLIMYKTGLSSLDVSKKIGRVGGYFKNYLEVVFPNKINEAKEKANPTIEGFLKDYNSAIPSRKIEQDSLERLLSFCEKNDALSFVSAVADINKEWFNMDSLSGTALIAGLRECACFSEKIGELIAKKTRKRNIKNLIHQKILLKTVVATFFNNESWFSALNSMWNDKSSFKTSKEFKQKYDFLIGQNPLCQNKEEDNILRAILLTSLVRNYVVHRNAEFRLLEENYVLLLRNAAFVIFLLWQQIERNTVLPH